MDRGTAPRRSSLRDRQGKQAEKQRRATQNQRAHRGTDLLTSSRPPKPIEPGDGTDPVAALRSMLLGRGWVEEPPDGVLALMWFEFPQSLVDFAPRGAADPDGIHPTLYSCASAPATLMATCATSKSTWTWLAATQVWPVPNT